MSLVELEQTKFKKKNDYEEEVALVIRSSNPAEIADQVANLEWIGGYKLVQMPDQHIIDTYLNTQSRNLKGSSLRIRSVNDVDFVTIKGKNIGKSDGPSVRPEFEVEWPWETPSVWDVAELFDMIVTQQRETNRRVRNIYSSSKKKAILKGELVIDEVCYDFDEIQPKIYEVEIEKRDKWFDVDNIAKPLMKKFPELERWKNSKLSTGNLLSIALGIQMDEDGVVTEDSFDNLSTLFRLL